MPSGLLVGDQVTFDYREGVMVTDASFKAGGGRSPKPKKKKNQKHKSEQEKSRSGFFSQTPHRGNQLKPSICWWYL